MKKLLLSFMLVLLLAPTALRAQILVPQENSDGEDCHVPFRNSTKYSWCEMIISGTMLESGVINSLEFYCATPEYKIDNVTIKIYLAETLQKDFQAGEYSWIQGDIKEVYSGTVTLGGVKSQKFEFNKEFFEYSNDNETNLAVFVSKSANGTSGDLKWSYADTEFAQSLYAARGTASYANRPPDSRKGTQKSYLPLMKVGYEASEPEDPETPEEPEVAEGDTWQNAIEIAELPFENTPDFTNLTNDYTLPGEAQDGPDAVYKFTLTEETTIAASVTGTNGKIALYAADFNGQEGPGPDNYYGATVEPEDPEDPELPQGPTTFSFDFNDGTIDGWRTIDADNDGNNWQNSASIMPAFIQGQYKVNGTHAINSATVTMSEEVLSPDNYIVTTEQYVITANSVLTWKIQPKTASGKDYYAVVVSADNENFTVVEAMYAPATTSVTECECSLASYAGQKVYIGLRHYNCVGSVDGYGPYTILVDDIVLSDGAKRSMRNSLAETTLPAGTYYLVASATEAFTVSANVVTEAEPAEGDTWQNAIEIAELPYEHTPDFDNLTNDYTLPGETEDGKDAVYKLILTESTPINASVTGTNGKIAVYTETAVTTNGITATNNIQVEEPGEDPETPEGPTTFFYDFEDNDLSDFTLVDDDGDGYGFSNEISGATGNRAIVSYSWNNFTMDPDNYIYTTQKYYITEQSQLNYTVATHASYSENYSVVISEDGENFNNVNTETFKGNATNRSFIFSGTEFVGKKVHIGFRHHDSYNNYYIEFDNFELTDGSSKSSRATATDNSIEGLVLGAGTYYIAASATEEFTINIEDAYVAQVNGVEYESMQEAVNAASAYLPITLLKNVEGPAFDVEKTVTINLNGKTYTINNELPINLSEGTLTLQNGTIAGKGEYTNLINITGSAQLVHDAAISGTMTKHVEGTENVYDWGTISSPVGTVNHSQVDGLLVEGAELYLYDEANEYWRYFNGVDYSSLEAGRGYLYASRNATDVKFTGTFGVDDVNYTLSCASEGQLKGFNMIGNPFTHDVNVDYFSISAGASYSNQFYVLSADGGWEVGGTTIFNINISPMKSVLIKTDSEATFTISNVKNTAKSRGENNGMLQINVSNSQYNDAAYVSFNKGLGLDKISHRNEDIQMVYIPVGDINYAVAIMDKNVTEVPVSFKAMTMGEYTISAKALDCEFAQMTLVDKLTGESTNLLLEDYTFMARSNDNASRFVIYLTGKDNTDVNSEMFVFHNNDELVINNIEGNAVVRIIDIMGRPVAEYNVSGSANISTASFANGVYMVQMSDENGVKVQKVVID